MITQLITGTVSVIVRRPVVASDSVTLLLWQAILRDAFRNSMTRPRVSVPWAVARVLPPRFSLTVTLPV